MKYLLDTDTVIDMLRGSSRAPQRLDSLIDSGVAVSAMTYGELWEGIVHQPRRDQLTESLERLLTPITLLILDQVTMLLYGEIRSLLRQRGLMIPAPDILIASTALQHNLSLITGNLRHFSRIPGLQILTPADLD